MFPLFQRPTLTEWLLIALLAVNVAGFAALFYRLTQPMPILDPISVIVDKPY